MKDVICRTTGIYGGPQKMGHHGYMLSLIRENSPKVLFKLGRATFVDLFFLRKIFSIVVKYITKCVI